MVGNAMRGGGDDIVLPVTNHADAVGLQLLGLQQMGDQLGLVLKAAVEFRAVDAGQQRREAEIVDDPAREAVELRCAEHEACPPRVVAGHGLQDTRIDPRLIQPPLGVPLAIAAFWRVPWVA
jgi:hypothetical protein